MQNPKERKEKTWNSGHVSPMHETSRNPLTSKPFKGAFSLFIDTGEENK